MFSKVLPKRRVHGFRVMKCFGHVRGKKYDVRTLHIPFVVLASNGPGCGCLFGDVDVFFAILIHRVAVPLP